MKWSLGSLTSVAICLAVTGCQWETEPAVASRGELGTAGFFWDPEERSKSACLEHARDATTEGCPRAPTGPFPGCGQPFSVDGIFTRDDSCACGGDCPRTYLAADAECTCRGQATHCLFQDGLTMRTWTDGVPGVQEVLLEDGGCGCNDIAVLCDCGDGRGEVYTCECAGGGDEECFCDDAIACSEES
jgi:hypothetical protein